MLARSMHAVCNDTKWEELRLAMLDLPGNRPSWRTKSLNGFIYGWDVDWLAHFRLGPHSEIEWCEISASDSLSCEELLAAIEPIGLSGLVEQDLIRIYGYVADTGSITRLRRGLTSH